MSLTVFSHCDLDLRSQVRALTRILKTGVPEPSLSISGSPKRIWPPSKTEVSAPKMGVLDCKSAVSESSAGLENAPTADRLYYLW